MKRFMGMMPRSEIYKEAVYKDQYGMHITVQSGPHGWSVIWNDGSSDYQDIDLNTEHNFNTASHLI